MLGDTQSRKETPVKLVALGYNSTASSDLLITSGSRMGDLAGLVSAGTFSTISQTTGTVQKQNAVRIPKPYSGDLTEIYLTFRLRLGDDETGTRSMWIGYANADSQGVSPIEMNEAVIKKAHEGITGNTIGFQAGAGGYIQFNRLNITRLLKDSAEGKGWHGLVFLFDQKPVRTYDGSGFAIANGYALEVFKLDAAARFKGAI